MKTKILIWMIAGLSITCYSQYKSSNLDEIEGWLSLGTSSYSGDIGSKMTSVLPSFDVGLRYFISDHFALNGHLMYAGLKGNDHFLNTTRGYSFKTNLGEVSANFEFYLYKTGSKFYKYYSYKGTGSKKFNFYCSIGAGMIVFSPKAYSNGNPEDLSKDYYNKSCYVIPFGGGVRYTINKKWSMSVSFKERFTITDYLDDYSSDTNGKDVYFVSMISIIHKFNRSGYF